MEKLKKLFDVDLVSGNNSWAIALKQLGNNTSEEEEIVFVTLSEPTLKELKKEVEKIDFMDLVNSETE